MWIILLYVWINIYIFACFLTFFRFEIYTSLPNNISLPLLIWAVLSMKYVNGIYRSILLTLNFEVVRLLFGLMNSMKFLYWILLFLLLCVRWWNHHKFFLVQVVCPDKNLDMEVTDFTFIVIFEAVGYFQRNVDRALCFFSSLILLNI